MNDSTESSASVAADVALAGRILALHGYEDLTLGHVSCRGETPNIIHIKRKGPALSELVPEDILEVDIDDPNVFDVPSMHLEAVLHTETYRVRPDVHAVIHGHPWYATALAGSAAPLEMLTHDAAMFSGGLPVFSETSAMITTVEQGEVVAKALGDARALIMQNHGVLVTGPDLKWAVLAAVTLERAARMQVHAKAMGPSAPIDDDELADLTELKYQDRFMDEYWEYFERKVRLAELAGRLPSRQ